MASESNETADAPGFRPEEIEPLATGFLAARGYALSPAGAGVWIGAREGAAGPERAAVIVAGRDGLDAEAALVGVEAARAAGVETRVPVIAVSRHGISQAALSSLTRAGATLLYPLAYLDWYFRRDQADSEADGAGGIDARLRAAIDDGLLLTRAPQPYRRLTDLAPPPPGAPADGRDLLETLLARSAAPERARLTVICGAAGVGKTVLVNAYLRSRHDGFNAAKRRAGARAARPLLFNPVDLGAKTPDSVDALIDAMLSTALTEHAPPSAFHWLHDAGLNTWIFDGLDEFFRGQNDFFPMLDAKLDDPASRAEVILCTRDSLLSSSPALLAFAERRVAAGDGSIEIYELQRWDRDAKRAYIEIALAADAAAADAAPAKAAELMGAIEADPALAALTDLPFYCDLFVGALRRGDRDAVRDEFSLLRYAVDKLIEREAGKLSIDWGVFVSDDELAAVRALAAQASARGLSGAGDNLFADALLAYGQDNLEYLLGAAAHYYRYGVGDARALEQIAVEEWREVLSPAYLDVTLDDEVAERAQLALVQFAFFSRGESGETMTFTHELIADYLAARYAFSLIESGPARPEAWRQAFGPRADVGDTLLFRYVAARCRDEPAIGAAILPALRSGALDSTTAALVERALKA